MIALKDIKKTVQEMSALLTENQLAEIEVEQDGFRIRVSRGTLHHGRSMEMLDRPQDLLHVAGAETKTAEVSLSVSTNTPGCIKSPMVGTAYLSPEPGAAPFVKRGDKVKKGQTVLIVEAMKVMNPIAAHMDGVVDEILVTDKQPVEFDQPLILIN